MERVQMVDIINESSIEATYQWLLSNSGQEHIQICTGNCGVIKAYERITAMINLKSTRWTHLDELVFLVVHQEPIFLPVIATLLHEKPYLTNLREKHIFRQFQGHSSYSRLMENSLKLLKYIPKASVYPRQVDFKRGSSLDTTLNISQTISVTNHQAEDGFMKWLQDPENIFIIDPIELTIPPNESRLFTIRFRPKTKNEVYSYLLRGDYQSRRRDEQGYTTRIQHTWFRIPCIGNTLDPCTRRKTKWDCPIEEMLPPTVPVRTAFTNFLLSNKSDIPMMFKFASSDETNFAVFPTCGVIPSGGWQVVVVALEPKTAGEYYESWELIVNDTHKTPIYIFGTAETCNVDIVSQGYDPEVNELFEFPPTITGCTSNCPAYIHNLTRMEMHIRVLSNAPWLGGDNNGCIMLAPKEMFKYRWWFFPKQHNKVYKATVTCSCICLIDNKPVGKPSEIIMRIMGFSELPDLKALPKTLNLHDIVVGERTPVTIKLYNSTSCHFTFKLDYTINGMGDDYSGDKLEIESCVNSLKPSHHCDVNIIITADGAGPRQVDIKYTVLYHTELDDIEELEGSKKTVCTIWYDGIYPTMKIKRTISVKCPVSLSNHHVWNMVNVDELNQALSECRPRKPLYANLFAPDLCNNVDFVHLVFVIGCVYDVPVSWTLRREKICDCDMVEVQTGISTFEMRHFCPHRPLVDISPHDGIVMPDTPLLLDVKFKYNVEGKNTLCYVLSLPNERTVNIFLHVDALSGTQLVLRPLRRCFSEENFAILDCGRVPINNLDPVIRVLWLYNPNDVFATWRLLHAYTSDNAIKCLQLFTEVAAYDRKAIPFSFLPSEMIDYEVTFYCTFGYDTLKVLVKGQGGLPNCVETRLDIPFYTEKLIRSAYRTNVVYLSQEHITLPIMPTHSLMREIIAINNDTDHYYRFIWFPERIDSVVNVVMTPYWGVIAPGEVEWITMTVYTLREPATLTTMVTCEILDLTVRKIYHKNEMLRKKKTEQYLQEFVITEKGKFYKDINDCPPYVSDLPKPRSTHLALSLSICSQGQRDGCRRMSLRQMWGHPPPYDLLSSDLNYRGLKVESLNNLSKEDIIKIIDDTLWQALHNKMFRHHLEYYVQEEIPSYDHLVDAVENDLQLKLSRRVTSGVCDAIVNKIMFHNYNLKQTKTLGSILEAE
ncbi:cilia- and flagella-associated protein 65-like [Aricia agestis]|uniref:cilia- and flagella-associated protein 65-like n=1 Tax=Aricia agestis TaxID=91739 RepID=UPI001C205A39|nr:cilia- and flagella-associated protein 65-like [Aricia agestis]